MNLIEKIGAAIILLVIWFATNVLCALISAIPVYFLWNWLMPELFQLVEITFIQSLGICLLCGLLFRPNATTKKEG